MGSRNGIWLTAGLLAWLAGLQAACACRPRASPGLPGGVVRRGASRWIDEPVVHIPCGKLSRFESRPSGHPVSDDPKRAPNGVTGLWTVTCAIRSG